MTTPPLVTVVIPARNEERDIAGCIDAVGAQDHPAERIQLVVIDSGSTDGTFSTAREAVLRHPFGEVVFDRNPRRRTSVSLNIGLDHAKGQYVARVDARSRIEPGYLSACLRALQDPTVGVVGGAQVARPRSARTVDVAIASALRNRWATGLSRYRRANASGPSDTVWMGFFRTGDLRALGGWSEDVALNEDYDLNERFRGAGFIVWFDHTLRSGYLPRPSLALLARQYFYFGRVKGTWWARGRCPSARQVALLAAPPIVSGIVAVAVRRIGPVAALALPAGLVAVEAAGSDGVADARTRAVSAAAIGVLSGSWWVGTVVGFFGEIAGVRHQHG